MHGSRKIAVVRVLLQSVFCPDLLMRVIVAGAQPLCRFVTIFSLTETNRGDIPSNAAPHSFIHLHHFCRPYETNHIQALVMVDSNSRLISSDRISACGTTIAPAELDPLTGWYAWFLKKDCS
jgi:hypothetical protein